MAYIVYAHKVHLKGTERRSPLADDIKLTAGISAVLNSSLDASSEWKNNAAQSCSRRHNGNRHECSSTSQAMSCSFDRKLVEAQSTAPLVVAPQVMQSICLQKISNQLH